MEKPWLKQPDENLFQDEFGKRVVISLQKCVLREPKYRSAIDELLDTLKKRSQKKMDLEAPYSVYMPNAFRTANGFRDFQRISSHACGAVLFEGLHQSNDLLYLTCVIHAKTDPDQLPSDGLYEFWRKKNNLPDTDETEHDFAVWCRGHSKIISNLFRKWAISLVP